jgi:hypothetical protein
MISTDPKMKKYEITDPRGIRHGSQICFNIYTIEADGFEIQGGFVLFYDVDNELIKMIKSEHIDSMKIIK